MSDEGNALIVELRAERDELFAEARQRAADAGRLYVERDAARADAERWEDEALRRGWACVEAEREPDRLRAVAVRLRDALAVIANELAHELQYVNVDVGALLADPEVRALEGESGRG